MSLNPYKTVINTTTTTSHTKIDTPATLDDAAEYAVAILKERGFIKLGFGEITCKYSFAHMDKQTLIGFSNLDGEVVKKIQDLAKAAGLVLKEKHDYLTPEEEIIGGLGGTLRAIHFSVDKV